MELVNIFKEKKPKVRETRLGIAAFICALITLAHFNLLLMMNDNSPFLSLFYPILPMIGVLFALLSFTRMSYKKRIRG